MERKYVAFISYRHAELDSAVAKQLHTLIEKYVIPRKLRKDGKKKLGIVFRDQEELPVSSDLSDDICRALDNAQYLIVVCTKNTAQSPWVGREISYFLSHHDRGCAFAALADGEPSEVFPLALTQIHNPDGTVTDVEPLAIDLRADSIPAMRKKAKREVLRLFAALIGCPYDSLVMREQRRKRRQLASIMAMILAVVTGFSAITLVKNHQIDQKNQELAGMNQTLEDKNLELEEKNDELARQKAEVQLRESELLTEKALSYLAEEDTQNAIQNALAALPSETEDRPYYALAEQTLTTAMGIYDDSNDDYEIFTTVLEQKTPIACYEISPDGTKIATLDEFGLVTCFDVASGEILWTTQVSDTSSADHVQIFLCPGVEGVIVSLDMDAAAVKWDDGEVLWEYRMDSDSQMFLSPDGTILAYRSQIMQSNLNYYDYAFEFLSATTGEVLQRIDLGTTAVWSNNEEGLSTWKFDALLGAKSENGAFSSDGKYFVSSYTESWESTGKRDKCYILLDLQAGTCQELYRRDVSEYSSVEETRFLLFTADDSAVLSVADGGTETAYRVECIDVQSGKSRWFSDTGVENAYFYSGDHMYAFAGTNSLFMSRGSYFYLFDIATGEHVHTMTADEREIVSLEMVESPFFSLIFSDGSYTLGWANDSGVYTSDFYYGPYLDIGTSVGAKLWNNGIVRMLVEDYYIQGTHVGTKEDPNGYIVSMPQAESRTIEIKRAVNFGNLLERTSVDLLPESTYDLYNAYVKDVGNDAFAMGKYAEESGEEKLYSYRMVDRETGQVTQIPLVGYDDNEDIFFPSDGSGYINIDFTKGMIFYSLDGKQTVLQDNTSKPYPEIPDQNYYPYNFDACVQAADGRLLTVALGEGKLMWWFDGKDKQEVAVPEDIRAEKVVKNNTYRFLEAGENGIILVANYGEGEDTLIQSFAAYDIHKGTWYRFLKDQNITTGFAGVAGENPWLTLNDDTNNVYIYDMPTDTLLYQFPLQLPLNSVDEIGLVLGDEYLAVKTIDMQVFLYDITTGQIVYNTQLEGYSDGNLHVETDAEGKRVYIWEDSTYRYSGVCVEKDSWTELAQIPGLLYYDTLRNKLYCYQYYADENGQGVVCFSPPAMEELVKIGEALMQS